MPVSAEQCEVRRKCVEDLEQLAEKLALFTSTRKNPEVLIKSELVDCARGAIATIASSLVAFADSVSTTVSECHVKVRDVAAAAAVISNVCENYRLLVIPSLLLRFYLFLFLLYLICSSELR